MSAHEGHWNVKVDEAIGLVSHGCACWYCCFHGAVSLERESVRQRNCGLLCCFWWCGGNLWSRESAFGDVCAWEEKSVRCLQCLQCQCWFWMFGTDCDPSCMLRFSLGRHNFSSHTCGCSIRIGGVCFPQGISFLVFILFRFFTTLVTRCEWDSCGKANGDAFPALRWQECRKTRGAVRRLFQLTAVSYCVGRCTASWAAVVIVLCALWCMFVDRPSAESQGICSRWWVRVFDRAKADAWRKLVPLLASTTSTTFGHCSFRLLRKFTDPDFLSFLRLL